MGDSLHTIQELDKSEIAHAIECEGTDLDGRIRINKSDFTMVAQNIVSIYKNFDDFTLTLSTLSFETDMIIFTECRLNQNKPLPQLNNYEVYCTTRQLNQNDGVVVYIKKTLKHKVKELKLQQASCLQVDVLNNTVLCIYRSPSNPNAENFLNSLDSHIESLPSHSSIIIAGDININIRPQTTERPQEYKNRMYYLDMLANYGILAGHTLPTREQNCLDHFMLKINKSKYKASIAVMQTTTTDHSTMLLSISKLKTQLKVNKIKQTTNFENALKYLQTKNLSELLFCNDPLAVTNNLIDKITESLKLNTSVSNIPCTKRIIQPWISAGILRCIRNRNKLQKNLRKDPHNDILRVTYRRYRNYCNYLIKRMKRQYDRENIIKSLNNNKLLWKNIKNITYNNQSQNTNAELFNLKSSPTESANFINSYFVNVGMQLANKIQNVNMTPIRSKENNPVPLHSFVLLHTDIEEVKNIILSLKSNSAPGWDNIPNDFMKLAVNDLAPIISHLNNLCFDTGLFPAPLKQSIITPVYKGGDRDDISNYRPISVLPAISKILEKLLNIRLINYLNKFDILAPTQFGFRQGRSTEDAILELSTFVTEQLDHSKKCLAVFLDLKKAFDTVSVPTLVHKLEKIGIRGTPLALFESYLSERKQKVKLPGFISGEAVVSSYGVPQGSVLGPTLFLIYVNDLCSMTIPNARILSYADDTAVVFTDESWEAVKISAESGLARVALWLQQNLLTLNIAKTNFICFSITNNLQPQNDFCLKIHMCFEDAKNKACDCPSIEKLSHTKYLGVVIDQRLSWYPHLEHVINRTRKLIWIFKTIRHVIPDSTKQSDSPRYLLNQIYTSLAQSIITYCIPVWGGAAKTKFLCLERAQRTLIKVMYFKKRCFSTEQLYRISGLLSVRQLYVTRTILKAHKSLPFDPCILKKRRKDVVVKPTGTKTVFASRQFSSCFAFLYNKINRDLNIYDKTYRECKNLILKWVQSKTYEETEFLLHRIS